MSYHTKSLWPWVTVNSQNVYMYKALEFRFHETPFPMQSKEKSGEVIDLFRYSDD